MAPPDARDAALPQAPTLVEPSTLESKKASPDTKVNLNPSLLSQDLELSLGDSEISKIDDSSKEKSSFPWKLVLLIFMSCEVAYIISTFLRSAVGPISDQIVKDIPMSTSQIGLLSGIFFLSFALFQIPGGVAIDTFGPAETLSFLQIITAIGCLLFGVGESFETLLIARFLQGAGTSVSLMGTLKIFSLIIPSERFALAVGSSIAFGSIGALFATFPLVYISDHLGWRTIFFSSIAFCFLGTFLIYYFCKNSQLKSSFPGLVKAQVAENTPQNQSKIQALKTAFYGAFLATKVKGFWKLSSLRLSVYPCFVTILGLQGVPYLTSTFGVSDETASLLLFLMASCNIVGLFAFSPIDYYLGSRKIPILCSSIFVFLCYVSLTIFPYASIVFTTIVFCLIGFFLGFQTIVQAQARALLPDHLLGRGLCTLNTFVMFGGFVLQSLSGLLLDQFETDDGGFSKPAWHAFFALLASWQFLGILGYSTIEDSIP